MTHRAYRSSVCWSSFVVNLTEQEGYDLATATVSHRPDGVIYTTMGLREITVHEKLRDKNVVLANCLAKDQTFPTYIPDDYHDNISAIKHVIEKGYRHPLCFYLPEDTVAGPIRRKAVEDAWQDAGLPCHHCVNTQCYLAMNITVMISIVTATLSSAKSRFYILICGNIVSHFLAYQVLPSMGLRIPEQVAVQL